MELKKAKLNPNAVNDKAPSALQKVNMTGDRRATHAGKSKGLPIPSTRGYAGKRIK